MRASSCCEEWLYLKSLIEQYNIISNRIFKQKWCGLKDDKDVKIRNLLIKELEFYGLGTNK